jgi:hypothetical protein
VSFIEEDDVRIRDTSAHAKNGLLELLPTNFFLRPQSMSSKRIRAHPESYLMNMHAFNVLKDVVSVLIKKRRNATQAQVK